VGHLLLHAPDFLYDWRWVHNGLGATLSDLVDDRCEVNLRLHTLDCLLQCLLTLSDLLEDTWEVHLHLHTVDCLLHDSATLVGHLLLHAPDFLYDWRWVHNGLGATLSDLVDDRCEVNLRLHTLDCLLQCLLTLSDLLEENWGVQLLPDWRQINYGLDLIDMLEDM